MAEVEKIKIKVMFKDENINKVYHFPRDKLSFFEFKSRCSLNYEGLVEVRVKSKKGQNEIKNEDDFQLIIGKALSLKNSQQAQKMLIFQVYVMGGIEKINSIKHKLKKTSSSKKEVVQQRQESKPNELGFPQFPDNQSEVLNLGDGISKIQLKRQQKQEEDSFIHNNIEFISDKKPNDDLQKNKKEQEIRKYEYEAELLYNKIKDQPTRPTKQDIIKFLARWMYLEVSKANKQKENFLKVQLQLQSKHLCQNCYQSLKDIKGPIYICRSCPRSQDMPYSLCLQCNLTTKHKYKSHILHQIASNTQVNMMYKGDKRVQEIEPPINRFKKDIKPISIPYTSPPPQQSPRIEKTNLNAREQRQHEKKLKKICDNYGYTMEDLEKYRDSSYYQKTEEQILELVENQ